jgi:hypothetical protein
MTVPITPGPFSFLGTAGQAVGGYLSGREDFRQRRRAEALQGVTMLLDMREKGLLPPEQFGHPEVLSLFQDAGISPPSAQATPDEQLRAMKGQYLESLNQPAQPINFPLESLGGVPAAQPVMLKPSDRFTTEQRALIGAPTQGALAKERLDLATTSAQIPEAAPTAVAAQQTDQDKTFNEIADRVVEDLYTRNGGKKLPTVEEALAVGLRHPRSKVFGGRIDETYYGQAIERLRAKLSGEDISRLSASQRYSYGLGGQPIDYKLVNSMNDMVKIADAKLKTFTEGSTGSVFSMIKLNNPKYANDPQVAQYRRIQEYSGRLTEARDKYIAGVLSPQEIQGLMREASTIGLGAASGGAVPGAKTAEDAKARMLELRKAGKTQDEIRKTMTEEGYKFQ